MPNQQPAQTVEVQCGACGSQPRATCVKCGGTGVQTKKACQHCGGTGSETRVGGLAPKCVDCRGEGWRELDNEPSNEDRW